MGNKIINESMRIAGKKINSDKQIDIEYPYTGEVIGTVPAGNVEHAKKAIDIGADAIVVLTDWEQFTNISLNKLYEKMRKPAWLFDTRSISDTKLAESSGFNVWRTGCGE